MKMTLSSPNTNVSNEKLTTPVEVRSVTPSSSPQGSPRPSPRPINKREHAKSDTHLLVNINKDPQWINKQDGSPSQDSSLSGSRLLLDVSSPDSTKFEPVIGPVSTCRERPRGKKKSSWFNTFNPTYKSRSEDFKKLFKGVPDDERLVVDYSCALQKEILLQGRLYVSQNYLCFYANIFGWETVVSIKWKEVCSISKEKTALVIPNAILINTRQDKYFFSSLVSRDKAYLMLFRVWQNALMDQPMAPQEMWQWVHLAYGDELGLTSDDEDYVAPGTEEDKLSARLSVESFSEHEGSSTAEIVLDNIILEEKPPIMEEHMETKRPLSDLPLHTDMSDTTESEGEKTTKRDVHVECTASHEARQVFHEVVPIHIDQLFTLLFTSSKFYLDFHASRKTTDLTHTPWTLNSLDNSKTRVVSLTIALNQAMGPKSAQVTETQIMLPCSKAGYLYAIDVHSNHAGIPYADSFTVSVHYCLRKLSDHESAISAYAEIRYKKSVWGFVKGMIEKSCWSGLDDFYTTLRKALFLESEENVPDVKRKSRRKRRIHSAPRAGIEDSRSLLVTSGRLRMTSTGIFSSDVATMIVFAVLIFLVALNVLLYFKLWSLEESPPTTYFDMSTLKDQPNSHEEWIKLLQKQETLHSVEIRKWQRILKAAIQLLKQTEESLDELLRSISPAHANKIISIVQNQKDTSTSTAQSKVDEL